MQRKKLHPLTETEKRYAENNHNLIYAFLHTYNYNIEEFYAIVAIGFLKAVQVYHGQKDLRKKYDFTTIAWQYMRAEVGNHFRTESSQKRTPAETVVSLDAECAEKENYYNRVGVRPAEAEVMEKILIRELLENLSKVQQDITCLRMSGYSCKDIFLLLEINQATYYKELGKIRATVWKLIS